MTNNIEKKESMVFYRSFIDAISTLNDPQTKVECYEAIIYYGLNGTIPASNNPTISLMLKLVEPIIKSNTERHNKNVENGKKGGAPMGNQNARKKKQINNIAK